MRTLSLLLVFGLLFGGTLVNGTLTNCLNKIGVSIDVSASMSLDGAFDEQQFKDVLKLAMRLYLFKDHNACVTVFTYATTWKMVLHYTRVDTAPLRNKLLRAVDDLQFETTYPAYYTNWEAGLRGVVLANSAGQLTDIPNTLFFITNGPPTTRTTACTGPQPCDDLSQNMVNAQYASTLVQSFGTKVIPMGLGTNVTDEQLSKVAGRCDPTAGCAKNADYYHIENVKRDFANAIAKSLKLNVATAKEIKEVVEEESDITTTSKEPEASTKEHETSTKEHEISTSTKEHETSTKEHETSTSTKEHETSTSTKEHETSTSTKKPETSTSTSTTKKPETTTTTKKPDKPIPVVTGNVPTSSRSSFPPVPTTTSTTMKRKVTHQNRPPINTIHRPNAGMTATPYPQTDQQRTSFKQHQPPSAPQDNAAVVPPSQQQQGARHDYLFTHHATIIFIVIASIVAFIAVFALIAIMCCTREKGGNEPIVRVRDIRIETGMTSEPASSSYSHLRQSKDLLQQEQQQPTPPLSAVVVAKFSVSGPNHNKLH